MRGAIVASCDVPEEKGTCVILSKRLQGVEEDEEDEDEMKGIVKVKVKVKVKVQGKE